MKNMMGLSSVMVRIRLPIPPLRFPISFSIRESPSCSRGHKNLFPRIPRMQRPILWIVYALLAQAIAALLSFSVVRSSQVHAQERRERKAIMRFPASIFPKSLPFMTAVSSVISPIPTIKTPFFIISSMTVFSS